MTEYVPISGEDNFYKENECYQLGNIVFNTTNESKIKELSNLLRNRIRDTLEPYGYSLTICDKDENITLEKLKNNVFTYALNDNKIEMYLNHSYLGGGDFLHIVSNMFNGSHNNLININELSLFKKIISFTDSIYRISRLVFSLRNIERISFCNQPIVFKRKYKLTVDKNKKYEIIKDIYDLICTATSRRYFFSWIPIALVKGKNDPYNNVSVIPFIYEKGDTIETIISKLDANKSLLVTLKVMQDMFKNTDKIKNNGNAKYFNISKKLKSMIDLVITMGSVYCDEDDDIFKHLDFVYQSFVYNSNNPGYPYYICSTTVNNQVHQSFRVLDSDFDIEKVKEEYDIVICDQKAYYQDPDKM